MLPCSPSARRGWPRLRSCSSYLSVFVAALLVYNVYLSVQIRDRLDEGSPATASILQPITSKHQKIAWVDGHGQNVESGYLKHVFDVFRMLGYKVITGPDAKNQEWDVMWIHDWPFNEYKAQIEAADWTKSVNHVPGSAYYTSKVQLATANITTGIPKAFRLPQEKTQLVDYAKAHPDYYWVQKSNQHRNIKITHLDQLNLSATDSFVQRFVDKPLLIDNRKFDIGIYTVVTSLNPLRVYTFHDAILRFCPKDYQPFDPADVDKYVVGDDYTPIWEMPSLKSFYTEGKMTWKDTLVIYLKKHGKDPKKIWEQIEQTIAEVFASQQAKMLAAKRQVPSQARFFELSRFDFVVDEELNVYLMEANMSPNLSSGHFKPNQALYEQVIYNVISLIGAADALSKEAVNAQRWREGEERADVNERALRVTGLPQCWDGRCEGCKQQELCGLCGACIVPSTTGFLREVQAEHLGRRSMTRVRMDRTPAFTEADKLLRTWYAAKCQDDKSYC